MRILYNHLFAVTDLAWRPTRQHAEKVHQTLVGWGLVGGPWFTHAARGGPKPRKGKPALRSVVRGEVQVVDGAKIARGAALPQELLMAYGGTEDVAACARVFGDEETFVEAVDVWLGAAPKVVECGYEGLRVKITRPPKGKDGAVRKEVPVAPDAWSVGRLFEWREGDRDLACELRCLDTRTGSPDRPPPPGYAGWFRSGVLIDCGKSRPAFIDRSEWGVPNRDFVSALEGALGAKVAEVGLFY